MGFTNSGSRGYSDTTVRTLGDPAERGCQVPGSGEFPKKRVGFVAAGRSSIKVINRNPANDRWAVFMERPCFAAGSGILPD